MNDLKNALNSRNNLLSQKDREIADLQNQVRNLRLNNNSANLNQAIIENRKKAEMEKQRADQRERQLAEMQNELNRVKGQLQHKNQTISGLNAGNQHELNRIKNLLSLKERDLNLLRNQNTGLNQKIRDLESANINLQNQIRNLQNEIAGNRSNPDDLKNKERIRALELLLKEKEDSNNKLLQMKDQQLNQVQENLQFFRKQAQDFKNEANRLKNGNSQKVMDLEKLLDEQNDQMQLMRRDIIQMEKDIEGKDQALKKMTDIQFEGKVIIKI